MKNTYLTDGLLLSSIRRFSAIALICLPCFFFPAAIATLAQIYGPLSDPGMDAPRALYAMDSLFWADVCFTAFLIWKMSGRRLALAVSLPALSLTGVLDVFGGMWVSGDYF